MEQDVGDTRPFPGPEAWLRREVAKLKGSLFKNQLEQEREWRDFAEAGIEVYRHEQKGGFDRWGAKHRGETFAEVDGQRYATPKEAINKAVRRFQNKENA
jgi:hypothetical protein